MTATDTAAAGPQSEATAAHRVRLVGARNFVRSNPMSDLFPVHRFHHVEFWCSDATTTYKRFVYGLGMRLVAKSDHSTGNQTFASYVAQSGDLVMAFTAPYGIGLAINDQPSPFPGYDPDAAHRFVSEHGLAVRAVGVVVGDAKEAFELSVANGAHPMCPPTKLVDPASGTTTVVSEVRLFGDAVVRWMSGDFSGPFLPGFEPVPHAPVDPARTFGLTRLDHVVSNVHELERSAEYLMRATGFHEFAEFTAEDVGTLDSGLNSMVLANNRENVLMPVNEPTFGTKRKSQIQTYLEQNKGPGVQHLALKTDDIFRTLREMQSRSDVGGFDFMPRASDAYYRALPAKIGDALTEQEYRWAEELGVLVDKDDQGVLLQIFTRPVGDRPTIFLEIIQRVCPKEKEMRAAGDPAAEVGGCGGFGKGNFSELFKRIEDYERTLGV